MMSLNFVGLGVWPCILCPFLLLGGCRKFADKLRLYQLLHSQPNFKGTSACRHVCCTCAIQIKRIEKKAAPPPHRSYFSSEHVANAFAARVHQSCTDYGHLNQSHFLRAVFSAGVFVPRLLCSCCACFFFADGAVPVFYMTFRSGVSAGLVISYMTHNSSLPSTMTSEWNAATEDYRRYQNMDKVLSS